MQAEDSRSDIVSSMNKKPKPKSAVEKRPAKPTPPAKKRTFKGVVFKILGLLIPALLLYWIFFVKIPSQVSYQEVWSNVTALSFGQNFLLLLAGLLTVLTYGWTSATVLPGLSLRKGTQSAVSGQLTSVVLPAPIDLAIRFKMYSSYGYSTDKSAVAVAVAGIARYFTVFALPVLGLATLIVSGQGTGKRWLWFVGGCVLIAFALWFMRLILSSTKSAHHVGRITQKVVNRLLRLIRRNPNPKIEKTIVDFGARTRDVAVDHFKPIAISNIVWGLSCYFVLLLAMRFCGITETDMSNAYILLVTGCMLLLNAFPITPGGIGVTEAILLSFMEFPSPAVQTAFISSMFLYRIYSWLLPMPVGGIAYATWRRQVRNGSVLQPRSIKS